MRSIEELSVAETAEALSVPEETVRTRHHRARCLQERLGPRLDHAARDAYRFHLLRCARVTQAVLARSRDGGNASSGG